MVHIDFPAILPTAAILLILGCGNIMGIGFEKLYLMQNDMNLRTSEVISTYVYKIGLGSGSLSDFFYAAAIGLFNSVVNLVLVGSVNALAKKRAIRVCGKVLNMKERTWFRAGPGAAALEQKKNTGGWFFIVTGVIIGLLFIITAYPMILVLSSSFSDKQAVVAGRVILWPVDFSLQGYQAVFNYPDIFIGYRRTRCSIRWRALSSTFL